MFGYVIANGDKLSEEQLAAYRSEYCGVCKAIARRSGQLPRLTLTYDMTFLSLLLGAVYPCEKCEEFTRCIPHPGKHRFYSCETIDYAADMNVLLAYYNLLDNWSDDKNLFSLSEALLIKRAKKRIQEQYPRQYNAVHCCLERLSLAEKRSETNPDIPAGIFGELMGELFVFSEDENAPLLRAFGYTLGRFIYIMDACLDFKSDLKKKRYNPLVSMTSDSFEPTLHLLMGECAECFERLSLMNNRDILENIIYSGVWTRWEQAKRKAEKRT